MKFPENPKLKHPKYKIYYKKFARVNKVTQETEICY